MRHVPNFIKIGKTVEGIWRFNCFQNGGRRHIGFSNSNFLTVWTVKRPILHQRAKFCENQPIRCCDIAIFVIFKMAAAAISDFQNFDILTVCRL